MKKLVILFLLIILIVPVSLAKSYDADLIKAVMAGNYTAMIKALKAGASPDATDHTGEFTALLIAIDNNDLQAAQILLDYGADPDLRSKTDMSPVLRVVVKNTPQDSDLLRLLLEHGADFEKPNEFQYEVNPVSLAMKLKNYSAFNMFNEYRHFDKCDIAFYKMQGQTIKNAEHWKAIETWKSCKMLPVNESMIGLSLDEIIKQYGKPISSKTYSRDMMEVKYVNLYSKYVENPVRKRHWTMRPDSVTDNKLLLINRCKENKTFLIDRGIVVDIRNSEYKGENPIQHYQPIM